MDRTPEPDVAPDWAHAPLQLGPETIASRFARSFGAAVHAALARWQRTVDAGGRRSSDGLIAQVRREAMAARLPETEIGRALRRLDPGLRAYARGPWPRHATIFLEQPVRHRLVAPDGFAVDLHLRVDRVARYRRSVAIIDFKTVTPHALEMRADRWQLLTYALAAPDLLGVAPSTVHLFVVDLLSGSEHVVLPDRVTLETAAGDLLRGARCIAAGQFDLGQDHDDRPCWSCGFRLTCAASLAPKPPAS